MLDDTALQAMVVEQLAWNPQVNAAHIGVSAHNGVVTLTGYVDSYAAKAAVEAAARRVRGVRAIAEEIEVRLPADKKQADDQIAERAIRLLDWDIEVPHSRIEVKVEHGVITLSGNVDFRFQRSAAEEAVRRLGGVRRVVNLIAVTHQPNADADRTLILGRIADALRRNAEIDAGRIRVDVDGDHVILRGSVRSWAERGAAEDAAWATPGVVSVENAIGIAP